MPSIKNVLFATMLAALSATAHAADDYDAILEQAIAPIEREYEGRWSFTEAKTEGDEVRIASYDPRRDQDNHWQLEQIDGREPTEKEFEKFLQDKAKESKEAQEHEQAEKDSDQRGRRRGSRDVREMIEPGTLTLLEETEQHWMFSFQPADVGEDFNKHLDGTLRIIKDGPYLDSLVLESRKPFKPQFGIKVNDFSTRLQFEQYEPGGAVLLTSVRVKINLRAFMVKTVDKTVDIAMSNFESVRGSD